MVTQRRALVKSFHTPQTLTAIHDNAAAWLGFGSALRTLKDQFSLPTAPLSILSIALYLTAVAVLHIAIPASFGVNVYNGTSTVAYPTQLARVYNMSLYVCYYR